jgi:uncharacterized RDD family membrane protein YckC
VDEDVTTSAPEASPWSRPGSETADEPFTAPAQPDEPTPHQGWPPPDQGSQPPQHAWQATDQGQQSLQPQQPLQAQQPYQPAQAQQPYQSQQPAQAQQAYQPQQVGPGQQPYPQQPPFQPPQADQTQWQPVPQQGGGTPYPPPPNHPMPYPPPARQRSDYARWGRRVVANLIDFIPAYVVMIVTLVWYVSFIGSMITTMQQGERFTPDLTSWSVWMIVIFVLSLGSLGWNIYNRWITGGRTGQSLGKRVTKIKLISEQTGQPIGAGNAFLRDIVHYLDGIAYVGYLWPLWDEKRQTFADKLMRTIVVDQPDQPR